jgi:hypothetical protein
LERTSEDPHAVRGFRRKYETVSTFITIKLNILILEDDDEVFIVNISNKLWRHHEGFGACLPTFSSKNSEISYALSSQSYKMKVTLIYNPLISESK